MSVPQKIKTCIIGNASVGKTSIINKINQQNFKHQNVPTIGIDYNNHKKIINGKQVTVQLWDTTGQERYKSIVTSFLRESDGIFLTFDMSNQKTLHQLELWIKQLDSVLPTNVPKILLGNKNDLKSSLGQANTALLQKYCNQNNMKFFKISAKSGQNINEAYNSLIEQAYKYSCKKEKGKTFPILRIEGKKILEKKPAKKCF